MANPEKQWKAITFGKWKFEQLEYAKDHSFGDYSVKKGWIPNGGLHIRKVHNDGYRMAHNISVAAIWVFPTEKAKKEGFKAKKLIMGDPNHFKQVSDNLGTLTNYDSRKYYTNKANATATGIGHNFATFKNSVIGELSASWKTQEKIFGEKSDYLYIKQRYVFTKLSSLPAHEPTGGINAARLHPLTKVYYPKRGDGYIESVRIDYRLHLNLDTYANGKVKQGWTRLYTEFSRSPKHSVLKNHAGVFRDEDIIVPGYPANKAVFASAEKPIKYEIVGDALVNGSNVIRITRKTVKKKVTEYKFYGWDNIHWWGAGGNRHASAPGAFHAIHIHWRWGLIIQNKPNLVQSAILPKHTGEAQFKGKPTGGELTDPNIQNQTLRFAIVKKEGLDEKFTNQSTEDFQYQFKHLAALPDAIKTKASEGEDLVLFYSVEVHKKQSTADGVTLKGNVFLHGLFFAHQIEQEAGALIGANGTYYVYPEAPSHQWVRNPYA